MVTFSLRHALLAASWLATPALGQQPPDFTQDFITDPAAVKFTSGPDNYEVTFTNSKNFVVGKGWKIGTERNITFKGDTTATTGTVTAGVYGWTQEPLVEYYIQEFSTVPEAPKDLVIGEYTSDGGTYKFWKFRQVQKPSIKGPGLTDFDQFVAYRVEKRPQSGTVTTANHFREWAKAGLVLGKGHVQQSFMTEGYANASGHSAYTVGEAV